MMKKKKWLSFLLAFAVAISACTSAIAAFAAPADAEAVAKAIEDLVTKDDLKDPLKAQYKDLSIQDKESINPELVYKLYNLCYAGTSGRSAAQKIPKVIAALGDFTDNMKSGMKLSGAMQHILPVPYTNAEKNLVENQPLPSLPNFNDENYRLQYEAYKKMWADATEYRRQFADLESYYDLNGVEFIGTKTFSTASTQAYVSLFYAEQQYLGENTPEKIQESFKNFPWSPTAAVYFNTVVEYADVYNSFMKGNIASADFVSKVNAIDDLKLPNVDLGSVIIFAILNDGVYTSVSASNVFSAMRAEKNALQPMLDFYDLINGITIPEAPTAEFNEKISQVWMAGKQLASADKYNLETVKKDNPDVYAKYEKICDFQFNPFLPEKDGIAGSHTSFKEEVVKYEMGRPYGDILVKTLLPAIDGLQDLGPIADQLLFNNANIKPVVVLLSGLLGESSPVDAAGYLANFGALEVAARLSQYNTWDEVPANFDWGVTAGDYEAWFATVLGAWGFIPAIVQSLLPNTVEIDPNNGQITKFTPGIYENVIIPLLEAFGAENVMDSVTYTQKCKEASNYDADTVTLAQAFEPMMIIIRQVYGVYRQILNDPVTYLTKNLPNLVYHLEDGCIFDAVGALLDGLSGLLGDTSAIKQYLSLEGIFTALAPTLEQAGIKLDINDIKKFAHLGEATVVPTASMTYENTIYVVGNKDSVIAQLSKILEPIALQLLDSGLGFSFDPLKDFVKVEAPKYPHDGKMGKDVMNAMIAGLDGLLSGFVNLNDTINNALCTPVMAADAITGIYKALANINIGGIAIPELATPKLVASMLTEDKYKEICAALQVNSWNDVALVVKNGDTVFDIVDMGFEAGDRQGFVDCLTASLRPLVKALADLGLLANTLDNEGNVTGYGLYETVLIPLFEALGVKPAADSATFTSNYNKLILRADKGAAYDYLLKTVLSPVLDLVNQLAASPADTLMGLLPNLAYAVQYNEDLAFIGNLLAGEDGNIDLAGMLNGLIGGLLPGFELPAIPLDALASCGEVKTMKSMSQLHDSYTNVVADKSDAFVTVFYYLYDAINYKDNMKVINELIAGIEGIDPSIQTLIGTLLNDVFTAGKEEALCMLGGLLASDLWVCPDGDSENTGDTTPSNGDASIAAAVILPVMFAAGAAIFFLRKKKPEAI